MWSDPVVDEIHQIRQQMLVDAGGDFHIFMQKIRSEEAASQRTFIVSPVARKSNSEIVLSRDQGSVIVEISPEAK